MKAEGCTFLLVALLPATTHAQIHWCDGFGFVLARPATIEWTDWLTVGSGSRTQLGGGLGFDVNLARGHDAYGLNGYELRGGPWLAAAATFPGVALEGGLSIDLGMTSHSKFGDVALRLGAGEADLGGGERRAVSATLTYGVRSVLARYSSGDGCFTAHGIDLDNPGRPARRVAHASGARLFGTVREDVDHRTAVIVGIELEPTFVLPPYSLSRLGGGPPE